MVSICNKTVVGGTLVWSGVHVEVRRKMNALLPTKCLTFMPFVLCIQKQTFENLLILWLTQQMAIKLHANTVEPDNTVL